MPIKIVLAVLVLTLAASAQILELGPLNQPPIDPSNCTVSPTGQTRVCAAKDGVHVSIAGLPYGGALCDSINPACKGPGGIDGTNGAAATIAVGAVSSGPSAQVTNTGTPQAAVFNFVLPSGPKGDPGLMVGNTVTGSGSLTCAPQKGQSVPSGFTCVFTNLSFLVTGIK